MLSKERPSSNWDGRQRRRDKRVRGPAGVGQRGKVGKARPGAALPALDRPKP